MLNINKLLLRLCWLRHHSSSKKKQFEGREKLVQSEIRTFNVKRFVTYDWFHVSINTVIVGYTHRHSHIWCCSYTELPRFQSSLKLYEFGPWRWTWVLSSLNHTLVFEKALYHNVRNGGILIHENILVLISDIYCFGLSFICGIVDQNK